MPKHGIRLLLYFYAVLSLGCFMLNTYCCHKMPTSKMKKNKENVYVTYFIIDSPNWTVPEKKKQGQSFPFDACDTCHQFDASNKK